MCIGIRCLALCLQLCIIYLCISCLFLPLDKKTFSHLILFKNLPEAPAWNIKNLTSQITFEDILNSNYSKVTLMEWFAYKSNAPDSQTSGWLLWLFGTTLFGIISYYTDWFCGLFIYCVIIVCHFYERTIMISKTGNYIFALDCIVFGIIFLDNFLITLKIMITNFVTNLSTSVSGSESSNNYDNKDRANMQHQHVAVVGMV